MVTELNPYQAAIVRNAEWFLSRQDREGRIDAPGDEFYGLRGDATLVGHSASVQIFAYRLTANDHFLEAARRSLEWLAARQDPCGGWSRHSAFTLDGAQCVFEGFQTFRGATGETRFDGTLLRAADRMVRGVLREDGSLRLGNIIEIGEYGHFAMLAYKATREPRFRAAADRIVAHIVRNYDSRAGYWVPYDLDAPVPRGRGILRPLLRGMLRIVPPRGRVMARAADHLLPFVAGAPRPQYSMSLMDAEPLLDTLDSSCEFPELARQTRAAVGWAVARCRGPFLGSLVESAPTAPRDRVYPVRVLNDSRVAALWPTACLLLAYCGLHDPALLAEARAVADRLVAAQDGAGAFRNFRAPDGSFLPLRSGNVNFYASMALWVFNEVYGNGPRFYLFPG